MKKKYIASFLSLCMIFSSVNPVILASETADISAVSDASEVDETETQELAEEDDINDETIEVTDEQDENSDDEVLEEFSDNEEEIIIDITDEDLNNSQIAEFSLENESLDNESQSDSEYTVLTAEPNIQFKYDKANTTLYFKLVDDSEHVAMPAGTNSQPTASQWASSSSDSPGDIAKEVTKIVIEDGITAIGDYDFQTNGTGAYKNVTEVVLPKSVKEIGTGAFNAYNVSASKKSINLENVEIIGKNAFYGSNIGDANLKSITTLGESAFKSCENIKNINFNADSVNIGESAFEECKNLESVSAKEIASIGDWAFYDCSSLSKFSCTKAIEIGESAFASSAIEEISIKGLKTAGEAVFDSAQLKKISLEFDEENCTDSFENLFNYCEELESVCYAGTTKQWNAKNITLDDKVVLHCKNDIAPVHATCETAGQNILICEICGGEYTDGAVAPALGHDYAEVTTQPTCIKDGVRTLTCSRCKDVKTETIPATGVHQWGDWKKTADATVFAAEQQERSCATCDKKETRTVGDKLVATAAVSASSVTLKEKQSTGTVKVTGLANGDSITLWKSTNTKVFTVSGKADGTCKLTGIKKGDAKLEITLASGLKKTVSVKVQVKTVTTSKISGLAKKMTVKKGEKATLKPVITPATSQQKVTYSSSNKSVATVSSKGVITAKKAGTAKITVKSGSKKVTVTVTVPKTKTTAIKVGEKVSVKKGKTYSLKAKTTPSNSDEKITYKTSNKKIATVSKSGKIKGVKKGTATITIKSGKIVKKVKVTVK